MLLEDFWHQKCHSSTVEVKTELFEPRPGCVSNCSTCLVASNRSKTQLLGLIFSFRSRPFKILLPRQLRLEPRTSGLLVWPTPCQKVRSANISVLLFHIIEVFAASLSIDCSSTNTIVAASWNQTRVFRTQYNCDVPKLPIGLGSLYLLVLTRCFSYPNSRLATEKFLKTFFLTQCQFSLPLSLFSPKPILLFCHFFWQDFP